VRVLLVVEGTNDIEFLRRISRLLHSHDPSLPDLWGLERHGEVLFVPFGGGHVRTWSHRLAALGRPEFHLYDHEMPPETEYRHAAAEAVNQRDRCRAVVTRKRSLENYLHPEAISASGNIQVTFDDFDPVAAMVAKQFYRRRRKDPPWELRPRRTRNRMTNHAKRWLNTKVADRMTAEHLEDRDPDGEIRSWLETIARLAESADS